MTPHKPAHTRGLSQLTPDQLRWLRDKLKGRNPMRRYPTKREAVQRFVWAYMKAQETLAADPAKFADAYARLTGIDPKIAAEAAKVITLGAVVSPEQLERQAKAFSELGVIQKDTSGEIRKYWDASFVQKAAGK